MSSEDTVSVEELAAMHGANIEVMRRLLRSEAGKPDSDRLLPGAYHTNPGNPRRGEWRIPRAVAEAYRPRRVGRPSESE